MIPFQQTAATGKYGREGLGFHCDGFSGRVSISVAVVSACGFNAISGLFLICK